MAGSFISQKVCTDFGERKPKPNGVPPPGRELPAFCAEKQPIHDIRQFTLRVSPTRLLNLFLELFATNNCDYCSRDKSRKILNWPSTCAAVIPCFNEAESIRLVVSNVRAFVPRIVVVDDGSTDDTSDLAREAGGEVIALPRNSGKGAALRAGWKHARQLGFQWAISMDGDGQHAADDIPAFFECAERTSAVLVIGNRMQNPTGMPFIRRVVNAWMSKRLSKAANQSLPDSQCGFRLINLAAWSALELKTDRFEIESELTLSFARAGQKIAFVPIHSIYKSEHSKINPIKDSIRWFRWFHNMRRR